MPPCDYVTKSVEERYEHCKFFDMGVDFDHGGVEQNGRGGGCFSSLTVRICSYFVGKKQIEKTH